MKYPFGPRDAKVVKNLLALAEPDVIEQAWVRALNHQDFPIIGTLSDLERHFARFTLDAPVKTNDVGTGFVNSVTEGF